MRNGVNVDAICKNQECIKSDRCKRFLTQEGVEIEFKYNCDERFEWKWFWQAENQIVKVEDNNKVEEAQ
jgi:hypothetical protein